MQFLDMCFELGWQIWSKLDNTVVQTVRDQLQRIIYTTMDVTKEQILNTASQRWIAAGLGRHMS